MIHKIGKYIADNRLLSPRSRVLAGLSGGADSVCLVRVLRELGHEVVAVHCNFHLRGDESQRDEAFVLELCRQWGVECAKVDFDTLAYAAGHSLSVEMAARELRYGFFRQTMRDRQCEAIAVGHHQDDNIETLLLNLVRGTGLRGLCAIQPRNGDVVRPLLCVSRQEIEDYLGRVGQDYVNDCTNAEDAYARNKVRLNVLPELERINPAARANILTTIANLGEARKVYAAAIVREMDECCARLADGALRISIPRLMSSASPVSVLHETLAPLGFNRSQILGVARAVNECGRVFRSASGFTLLIDRDAIVVEPGTAPVGLDAPVPIADCAAISVELVAAANLVIDRSPARAYIDADRLRSPLTVRTPRTGDTFAPFGMKGRRKLVSDYLTDQKVNVLDKARQLLVCDGDEIVWVAGRRSSDLYRVTPATTRVLVLTAR